MTPEPLTITKKELVNRIADQTGQTKVVVKDILQKFLDEIIDELAHGNRLEFREFGVFEVRGRAARVAQNPRTLEKVTVPEKRVVKFKVGRLMREKVCENEPKTRPQAKSKTLEPAKAPARPVAPPAPPAPKRPPPSNSPF
jgi:integration host factor subunit beta